MKKNSKISIVIPTFNEKDGINKTIVNLTNSLKKNKVNYEIVISDGDSYDGTIDIIKGLMKKDKNIRMIINRNRGFGGALIDGSRYASSEIVIWVMGDSSDDFDAIPKMVQKVNEGFDMVIGSRNIKGGSRGDQDKLKALGSLLYSRLAKLLFRLPIYDVTDAFRAFKKDLIYKLKLENNNFAISPEFTLKANCKGYKLGEVPVTYSERKEGQAKTKLFSMGLFYYYLLFKYWIKNCTGKM